MVYEAPLLWSQLPVLVLEADPLSTSSDVLIDLTVRAGSGES